MNSKLENARREYSSYFERTVSPQIGLSKAELDKLGFEEIAIRIQDGAIRTQYRRLAIELLEENLRDHHSDRPRAIELFDAGKLCELRDWQDVAIDWEQALWALASQGDA